MSSLRVGVALVSLGLGPLAVLAQTTAADSPPAVNAIWVEKDIEFTYMAFTTYYSCDGLRDKLRWVLKEIGARPGFKVTVTGCMNTGPDVLPHARIRAAMPQAATPELLAELARDSSQRELVARTTGKSADVNEPTAQFRARTRRIEFTDDPLGRIEAGDCELVEQLRDHVFVPLGAKVVEDRMRCTPKQLNLNGVNLTIEVLEPVPEKK